MVRHVRFVANELHNVYACMGCTYLDNGDHKFGRVLELAHVDVEVVQLISPRLVQYQGASLSNSANASQVAGGVDVWIGRLGHLDLGDGGRD